MSLSNYDIVYACSELFSIYIIYYFFRSLFGVQIRNKAITISVYALYFVLTIGIHFVANIPFLNLIFTIAGGSPRNHRDLSSALPPRVRHKEWMLPLKTSCNRYIPR